MYVDASGQAEPSTLAHAFLQLVQNRPALPAFLHVDDGIVREARWGDVAHWVTRVTRQLAEAGARPGMHVASYLENSAAWIALDLAIQMSGCVHVALDPRLPLPAALRLAAMSEARTVCFSEASASADYEQAAEVVWHSHLKPTFFFVSSSSLSASTSHVMARDTVNELIESLAASVNSLDLDAPAQMLFTSGTTGSQRGVLLSHRNLISNARAKLGAAPQFKDDVRLNILPFVHAYARTCELSTWILSGSRLAIARDWNDFLRLAPIIEPTLVNLVPQLSTRLLTMIRRARRESLDAATYIRSLLGSRLRLLQVGGAALTAADWHEYAELGIPPLQGYGLTEASPVVCSNQAGRQRPGSVGPPVADAELRIDDEGVLWTRGPHVMLGYWRDPEATRKKIVDGWLDTGDLASMEADGYVHIVGRKDDQLVLTSGYKISPNDLQQRLSSDPWVEQLLIVGQGRPYPAALVWPAVDAVPDAFFDSERSVGSLKQRQYCEALVSRWREHMEHLPRALRIERVGLLPDRLTAENGCLNFKGAQRRRQAEHLLADHINALYASM